MAVACSSQACLSTTLSGLCLSENHVNAGTDQQSGRVLMSFQRGLRQGVVGQELIGMQMLFNMLTPTLLGNRLSNRSLLAGL